MTLKSNESINDIARSSRVLEIKERYENLLKEKKNDYEIQVKIIEKEHENKLNSRKRLKSSLIVGTAFITIILTLVGFLLHSILFEALMGALGVAAILIVHHVLSKEIIMPPLPNFDVVIAIWEDKNELPPLYVEVTVSERED